MTDENTREIYVILRRHGETLARIEGRLETQPERCAAHEATLQRIEVDLRGNGKAGLLTRVRILEDFATDVRGLLVWARVGIGSVILAALAYFGDKLYRLLDKHPGV